MKASLPSLSIYVAMTTCVVTVGTHDTDHRRVVGSSSVPTLLSPSPGSSSCKLSAKPN